MYYYLIELQMGFYPVAVVLQEDATHKITHHAQRKHSTQAIKDTLHTMNTTQKSKAIPVTGRGGL
jgi:hypothetical protein